MSFIVYKLTLKSIRNEIVSFKELQIKSQSHNNHLYKMLHQVNLSPVVSKNDTINCTCLHTNSFFAHKEIPTDSSSDSFEHLTHFIHYNIGFEWLNKSLQKRQASLSSSAERLICLSSSLNLTKRIFFRTRKAAHLNYEIFSAAFIFAMAILGLLVSLVNLLVSAF